VLYYNQKEGRKTQTNRKGKKEMPPIDITNISYHVLNDRKGRMEQIRAVGMGSPIAVVTESDNNNQQITKTLTSTGVIVIRNVENMIITMYLAEVYQAVRIFRTCYGNVRLPDDIYNKITLNNIMFPAV
jgi:hypothetical protein